MQISKNHAKWIRINKMCIKGGPHSVHTYKMVKESGDRLVKAFSCKSIRLLSLLDCISDRSTIRPSLSLLKNVVNTIYAHIIHVFAIYIVQYNVHIRKSCSFSVCSPCCCLHTAESRFLGLKSHGGFWNFFPTSIKGPKLLLSELPCMKKQMWFHFTVA